MQKKRQHLSESENENLEDNSENSVEYIKYIKKLELQRIVLNKIVNSDLSPVTSDSSIDPDSPDSN